MKDALIKIICLLLFAVPSAAQSLPTLQPSKAISSGKLMNGASYYLVANTASKGYADFTLIQKNQPETKLLKKSLSHIDCFGARAPYRFLASKGVGFSNDGFIRSEGGASIFSLKNVPVFDRTAVDSTLLIVFEMMKTAISPQCIIISGDISKDSMLERMNILSMLTAKFPSKGKESSYVWNPGTQEVVFKPVQNGKSSAIAIEFRSPRTPETMMATTQPLVTRMFANILMTIVKNRTREAFAASEIPLAYIHSDYVSSSETGGDETIKFTITTDKDSNEKAIGLFSSILGSIDRNGATLAEYQYAKDRFVYKETRTSAKLTVSNEDYVKKCTAAYLYGASLAEESTVRDFFVQRKLASEKEVELFNNYASALLSQDSNVSLTFEGSEEKYPALFNTSWTTELAHTSMFHNFAADTLKLAQSKGKARLKSETADPITGGKLWTYGNGMKVVFKQLATSGQMTYAFVIRGGSIMMPGLKQGETAFIGDFLNYCNIQGMSPFDFRSLLRDNGIIMKCSVSASDLKIYGSAPSSRLEVVLQALSSIASSHSPSPKVFNYYRSCESIKAERTVHSEGGLLSFLDSLRRPQYPCVDIRNVGSLNKDYLSRVKKFLDSQFARSNDGVLVILGDLKAEQVQKTLTGYLNTFQTSKSFAARPKIKTAWREGWYSYTYPEASMGPSGQSVNIEMSAKRTFTMNSLMTFKIASLALERAVTEAVAPLGMRAVITDNSEFFPTEQFSLSVSCFPVKESGLPEGVRNGRIRDVVDAVRSAIVKASATQLSSTVLSGYKEEVTNILASSQTNADFLLNESTARYSTGKDNVTGYASYIKAVSADGVRSMLKSLDEGEKTELIIQ